MSETKTCFTCATRLPLAEFNLRVAGSDRRHSSCKRCSAENARRKREEEKLRPTMNERAWPAVDVMENNAFNLWHGPVERDQPLRYVA